MKILYVFRSLAMWGGIERILVDKMNYLATIYGAEVNMLTSDQGSHAIPYQTAEGVHVEDLGIRFHQQYQYRGLRRLWMAWQLQRRFEQRLKAKIAAIKPDVIIAVATAHADSIAKVKGRVPLVVESHSICLRTLHSERFMHQYYDRRLQKALYKADAIVSLTEGDAREWRQRYGKRVKVIPNMVHLNTSGQYTTQQQRRVIFVGRFDYQKRVLDIIRIWQQVFIQHQDWQLHIYGEGEQKKEAELAAFAAHANITIHPPTADIFSCYCESSILVSTSLFEPFGLVIPEAMSCGVPVVAYDCPYGPASIITDGADGFLIPTGNEQRFAERLCQLMDDEPLRMEMGRKAITSAQRFSASNIMPLWKKLFDEVVDIG